MYLGLPILSYDVIYNRATTNNQAVYFNNVPELRLLLQQVDKLPLTTIGQNLKEFAYKKYLWSDISERYSQLVVEEQRKEVLLPELIPLSLQWPNQVLEPLTKTESNHPIVNKAAIPAALVSSNN